MADTGQRAHAGQSISVKVEGSNIQITLQGHGQSQAVGWGAVEDAVRADDERQVQSCKEDIDSLLTFAGLYSAALTALLALSFAMLQEDTAGESLQVLRQIALQTATYQLLPGGGLNTTATIPPPSLSPFEPPRAALRVNILWFASLVFSLSTASIAILVKQWLRAYTSYQTSSAQGRMRVRYFCHQGMEIWKVYEIAAVLPFLIQLALGLFFVGLCYFTAGVHPDLGHATLPLVVGWALFVIVVTILPVFSSHCPYKPAMFERLFSVIRPRLFAFMEASCILLYRLAQGPLSYIKEVFVFAYAKMFSALALGWTVLDLITRALSTHICQLLGENGTLLGRLLRGSLSYIKVVLVSACAKMFSALALAWTAVDLTTRTFGAHIPQLSLETPLESDLKQHIFGRLALQAWKRTSLCADSDRPYDEADAVKFGGQDAEVLAFADAMQSDDEMLVTSIIDAMKQSQHTIENIAAFVVGVLRSRDIVESTVKDEPPTTRLDCQSLTPRIVAAIANIVAEHHDLIRYDSPSRACCWLYRTLLSLPQPLPAGLFLDTLALYHGGDTPWSPDVQNMLERFSQPANQSLHLFLSAFKLFWTGHYLPSHGMAPGSEILDHASSYISPILDATLHYSGLSNEILFKDLTNKPFELPLFFHDLPLQDTIAWLTGLVRQALGSRPEEIGSYAAYGIRQKLELILRMSRLDLVSQRKTPDWTAQTMLMRHCSKYCIENSIEGLQWAIWCYAENPPIMMLKGKLTLALHVHFADEAALKRLYHAVAKFNLNSVSASNKSFASARVCYVIVHILGEAPRREVTAPVVRLWRRILRHVTLMLPDLGESHQLPKDIRNLVSYSLDIMERLDIATQRRAFDLTPRDKPRWQNQFKPEGSPFSNHLVFLLSRLVPDEASVRVIGMRHRWRVQVLEEKYKEDKDAVLKDDEHDDDDEEEDASEQSRLPKTMNDLNMLLSGFILGSEGRWVMARGHPAALTREPLR